MDSKMLKRYVVGNVGVMSSLFPVYNGDDARLSIGGDKVIYELNLTDVEVLELSKNTAVKVCTHEQILQVVQGSDGEGVWYPAQIDAAPEDE